MKFLILAASLLIGFSAQAKLVEKTVEYKEGETVLEGYLVFDDKFKGELPAVLVVHDWMGVNAYAKDRARELAKLGYVALAADIYGKETRPKDQSEAPKFAGKYRGDRPLLRKRIQSALDFVRTQKNVSKNKVAAIGYCFGGAAVLELARSGADVKAVVTFHGGLDNPAPTGKTITAKVLALHGADDPFVPVKEVEAFQKEMKDGKVDWAFTSYGNAVHSFSMPEAGNDNSKGAAYNKMAAERSWAEMKFFLSQSL